MNTRTGSAESSPSPATRWAIWLLVALVIAAGVTAAIRYSPRVTPLIDTIR